MHKSKKRNGEKPLGCLYTRTVVEWPDGNRQVRVIDWGHRPSLRKYAGFSRAVMQKGATISTNRVRSIEDVPVDERDEVLNHAHPILRRKLGFQH